MATEAATASLQSCEWASHSVAQREKTAHPPRCWSPSQGSHVGTDLRKEDAQRRPGRSYTWGTLSAACLWTPSSPYSCHRKHPVLRGCQLRLAPRSWLLAGPAAAPHTVFPADESAWCWSPGRCQQMTLPGKPPYCSPCVRDPVGREARGCAPLSVSLCLYVSFSVCSSLCLLYNLFLCLPLHVSLSLSCLSHVSVSICLCFCVSVSLSLIRWTWTSPCVSPTTISPPSTRPPTIP